MPDVRKFQWDPTDIEFVEPDEDEEAFEFAERSPVFYQFDEAGTPPLMQPTKALEYFRRLTPSIGVDPQRWGEAMQRHAFTLAVDTEIVVLEKVQAIIAERLQTGVGISSAPAEIDEILEQAGVSPRSSGYSEMVYRTNTIDAMNTGADEEMKDPDVADFFPVWKYSGVGDVRERDAHRVHNDKYFPNEVSFADVRDSVKGEFDGYNCRCTMIPIDKFDWQDLEAKGARIATF